MIRDLPRNVLPGEIYRPALGGGDLVVLGAGRARFELGAETLVALASAKRTTEPGFWLSVKAASQCDGIVRQLMGIQGVELRNQGYLSLCQRVGKWDLGVQSHYWDMLEGNLMPGALIDKGETPSIVTGHFYAHSDGYPQIMLTCECEDGRTQMGVLPLSQTIDGKVALLRPMGRMDSRQYIVPRGGVA